MPNRNFAKKKKKTLACKKGVCFVDFFQGAREEGPADLERANADAQVISYILYVCCSSLLCLIKKELNIKN